MAKPARKTDRKNLATNRKALHEYELGQRYEAGLALLGSEIKSVRAGQVSLQDSYVAVERGELWLMNAHIAPYELARDNHEPRRPRKLLLHTKEIAELASRAVERGYTIVPLHVYLVRGRAKIEIAPGRGRRQYDKRHVLAEKESRREVERALRERQRE